MGSNFDHETSGSSESLDQAFQRVLGVSPKKQSSQIQYDDRPSWWIRFASYSYPYQNLNRDEEEHVRRSRLTAWVILGLVIGCVALIPLVGDDPVDLGIVASIYLTFGVAIQLNHYGHTSTSAIVMIVIIMLACLAEPVLYRGVLSLDELPDYYLMAFTVALAALILPPTSAWVAMGANIVMFCTEFLLLPHAHDLTTDMAQFPSPLAGGVAELVRPVMFNIVVAFVAYFGVSSDTRPTM